MNNKDLFNAINIAAEEYVSDIPDSAEDERPVVFRTEKKPVSMAKRIVAATAACAAVVALGVGITVVMKNYSQRSSLVSDSSKSVASNIERNFAPAEEILRVRDVGFYSEGMSDDSRKTLEEHYKNPVAKESLGVLQAVSWLRPPDVLYFNDLPLDNRMLSHEAYNWLWRYCLMSEEDRAGMIMPDEVKYLTGGGFVRFGDLGFLEDKYTEQELEHFKTYCANPLVFSSLPPEPDVYYYNDIPYHLDQIWSEDAKNWLKWFCWLDEETQEALSGYVPEALGGRITGCNSEKPQEIVTYKGKAIDVRGVSYDTENYIKWYNSLSPELQAKVWYEPEELSEESLKNYYNMELPIELIGADGVPLTYADLSSAQTSIFKPENAAGGELLSFDEIEQWGEIRCIGFVYLAEPGSDEFKRYYVGDEIMGLKITYAHTTFRRFEDVSDPALYYAEGYVTFEGTAKVDVLAVPRDGGVNYIYCAVSGVPVIDVDEKARAEGRIVPKEHTVEEFADNPAALLDVERSRYYGAISGDTEQIALLAQKQGHIQKDVEIEEISLYWQDYDEYMDRYQVVASLPNADIEHYSTKSVSFSTAKEQVDFAEVKEVSGENFVGYELEYIMPSEKVTALKYVYTDGEVSVRDSSGFEIATQFYEKIERDNMVFWKGLLTDVPTVTYISESNAYIAYFESDADLSKAIDAIKSLVSKAGNEEKSPVESSPNAHLSTRSVTFSSAKEQVEFADVKEMAEPNFVGYELEYVMPSEKVVALNYVYTDGRVSVIDNSGGEFTISPEWYEKIERDNMVFWKGLHTTGSFIDSSIVTYISGSNAYIAYFESDTDLSKAIDAIKSLV